MDSALRALVWQRAGGSCEYCGMAQNDTPFRAFHIDHVVPRKHGGTDDPENLALACDRFSLHKGPNLTGIDDRTNEIVSLFHPRTQIWDEHFRLEHPRIIGVTPTGRAIVRVCNMNSPRRLRLRLALRSRA